LRKLIKYVNILVLSIGLGLFLWTVIPAGSIEKIFSLNPEISLYSEKHECRLYEDLLKSKFIVRFPKAIRFKEYQEFVIINENDNINLENKKNSETNGSCVVSLEVWIDGEGYLIEPGFRIIESFTDFRTQKFIFKVTPLAAHVQKGTLWIGAIVSNKQDNLGKRIPLFAIPFAIRVESLFGISPKIIRGIALVLMILALLLLYLRKNLNKKRK
jgi:hypothetical protein